MPSEPSTPSLSELVRTTGQAVLTDAPAAPSPTNAGTEEAAARQPVTAPELPPLVADLDFSDVPEAIRAQVIEKTAQKAKHYDGDYRRKTADLARERHVLETRQQDVLTALERLKAAPPTTPSKREAILDRIEADISDAGQREVFRQFRQGLREDLGVDALKQELTELKGALLGFQQTQALSRREALQTGFAALPKAYQPLVEKYQEQLYDSGMKYQNLAPKKLVQLTVTDEEYETAILAEKTRGVPKAPGPPTSTSGLVPHQGSASGTALAPEKLPAKGHFGQRYNLRDLIPKVFIEAKQTVPKA